ncbi:MAG TPA: hypothetical protein VGH51_20860, partial [Candidatus Angelobacter sp.]
ARYPSAEIDSLTKIPAKDDSGWSLSAKFELSLGQTADQSVIPYFAARNFCRDLGNTAVSSCQVSDSTLLRSMGTEFKGMQELLRHSTLRSTLDVYT